MGMAVIIAALLFFTIHGVDAEARDWWEDLTRTPERLIGLLDLHDVVRGGCGEPVERATARAFSTPAENGVFVGTLYWQHSTDATCGLMFERVAGDKEEVPTLESGYEVPAAIVFERRGQWFRIRLAKGSAWIRRTDSEEFLPYPDLRRENLAHTLPGWDGTLRGRRASAIWARLASARSCGCTFGCSANHRVDKSSRASRLSAAGFQRTDRIDRRRYGFHQEVVKCGWQKRARLI